MWSHHGIKILQDYKMIRNIYIWLFDSFECGLLLLKCSLLLSVKCECIFQCTSEGCKFKASCSSSATRTVLLWAGRLNWPASLSGLFSSFLLETMVTVALMRILSALLLALSPLSQYWEVIMWQGDLQHVVIGNVVNTWWVGCVFNTSSSFLFRYNVSPQLLFSSQYGLKGSQLS